MIHISAENHIRVTLKSRHSVKFTFQMNKEYFFWGGGCKYAPDIAWDIPELKINLSFILNPNSNGHLVSSFAKCGYPKIIRLTDWVSWTQIGCGEGFGESTDTETEPHSNRLTGTWKAACDSSFQKTPLWVKDGTGVSEIPILLLRLLSVFVWTTSNLRHLSK